MNIQLMQKHKKIITAAAIIIAIITTIIIGIIAVQATPEGRARAKLKLAQKYLNEQNYEQAALAYMEAIAIDPRCEAAYLGAAEAYLKTGKEDKAVSILEQAKQNLSTEALSAKLEQARAAQRQAQQQAQRPVQAQNPTQSPTQGATQGATQNQTETAQEGAAGTQEQPPAADDIDNINNGGNDEPARAQAPVTPAAPAPTEAPPRPTTPAQTSPAAPTPAPTEAPTQAPARPNGSGIPLANVGDVITFGRYEQDGNAGNGAEPIEWQVLERQSDRMLVISRYGLDCKRYNETWTDVTWETCTLRGWLNGEFYNTAFNSEEQKSVLRTTISNPDNAELNTKGGNATTDSVFCLSLDEARAYLWVDESNGENHARATAPTPYAISRGAWTRSSSEWWGGTCFWWLRSPGLLQSYAEGVCTDGDVIAYGGDAGPDSVSVRPALWIKG